MSDSLAAIKAFNSFEIKYCLGMPAKTCTHCTTKHAVNLAWLPVHQGITRNQKADELAWRGCRHMCMGRNLYVVLLSVTLSLI